MSAAATQLARQWRREEDREGKDMCVWPVACATSEPAASVQLDRLRLQRRKRERGCFLSALSHPTHHPSGMGYPSMLSFLTARFVLGTAVMMWVVTIEREDPSASKRNAGCLV